MGEMIDPDCEMEDQDTTVMQDLFQEDQGWSEDKHGLKTRHNNYSVHGMLKV